MFKNLDSGLTRDRYFEVQEQLGLPPEEEHIPPDMEDLPEIVVDAIQIYNRMGDRVYPEIGYVGKDYTNLTLYLKLYGIYEEDTDFLLELIEWLDTRAIKKAADQLKREYDKLKRKH